MGNCKQCGKELPPWSDDICLECSRENVRKLFKEDPELKQAFKETVDELKMPENIEEMARNTVKIMQGIQALQRK